MRETQARQMTIAARNRQSSYFGIGELQWRRSLTNFKNIDRSPTDGSQRSGLLHPRRESVVLRIHFPQRLDVL